MNVASLELCEELYKVSGWKGIYGPYADVTYDLGYLLRKLPHKIGDPKYFQKYIRYSNDDGKSYNFGYISRELIIDPSCTADTPENALCQLAIELWKQGILS